METQAAPKKYRLAILLSHPIHYLIDFYKELQRDSEIEVMVYFCSDFGIKAGYDETFGKEVKWYGDSVLDGLPHKFLKNYSPKKIVGGFFSVINPGIIGELNHDQFDAILIHSYAQFTSWLAWYAATKNGLPILFRGESCLLNKKLPLKGTRAWLTRLFFNKVYAFLTIGSLNAKYYKATGASEYKLVPAPYVVKARPKDNSGKIADQKKALGIKENEVIILSIGKLIPRKGPMDLLRAFELLCKSSVKCQMSNVQTKAVLLFVGDGPEREKIENYAKEKNLLIICAGFKRPEELPLYYSTADIFALPSYFETWGLVINEAMSYGLPIVTSDMTGAAYDLVNENKNGYIHKTGDITTLSRHLQTLVKDNELRKKLGEASAQIISHWSYAECRAGFLEAMRRVSALTVVIDPGSQHLHQSALAFKKAGVLQKYLTGIFYNPKKFPFYFLSLIPRMIKNKIINQLRKRERVGLDIKDVKTIGVYEWLYLLSNKIFPTTSKILIEIKNKRFGSRAATYCAHARPRVIFAPLTAALPVFKAAKANNIFCVLDQYIGHPAELNKVLEEELRKNPNLKKVTKDYVSDENLKFMAKEIASADLLVAGSEFVKKTLLNNNVPENKIAVVPYGVDLNLFKPKVAAENDNILKILFTGNISIRKGCHYLLEAVKELQKDGKKIALTMVGPMESNWFTKEYKSYFNWVPPVARFEMPAMYQGADIYAFPSLFEGSSLAIYEAMASGLPTITTDESGSVVRDNKDGFIIPSKNTEEIKKKILFFCENRDAVLMMGESARERAEEYSWERYHDALIETIRAKLT